MPDAKSIAFNVVPSAPLYPHLPNLPPSMDDLDIGHGLQDTMTSSPLDLLLRFLLYPPDKRLPALGALSHSWFSSPILLPENYSVLTVKRRNTLTVLNDEKTLGQLLLSMLSKVDVLYSSRK